MRHTHRRTLTIGTLAAALTAAAFSLPDAATAHPLGNFTVNHYTGLTVHPDRIDATIIIDSAEIPTAQQQPLIDRNADSTIDAAERHSHADTTCTQLADDLHLDIDQRGITWKQSTADFTYQQGEGGLNTSRLHCDLTADATWAPRADITVNTTYDNQRIGWHEITARGHAVTLTNSTVPATSVTDELRHYPKDPLAAPLDQRSAALRAETGQSGPLTPPSSISIRAAGAITALPGKISALFDSLVGTRELTIPIGLLALLLAVVLGASHAAMPGHGKTIMAAYLAGRRGTTRDAVTVGVTVTLTHTAGVLVLGIVLPIATTLAGETVLTWLGLASGLLITTIGLRLLHSAIRRPPTHEHHHHHHRARTHDHGHIDNQGAQHHDHRTSSPSDLHPHTAHRNTAVAVHAITHDSAPARDQAPASTARSSLIGMGIAGGLVPSPTALVVLLGAVAMGRTAFGVLLVIGYGLGMATTLALAGLLLIRLRDRIAATPRITTAIRSAPWKQISQIGPMATATLVILVGIGLTLRAVGT